MHRGERVVERVPRGALRVGAGVEEPTVVVHVRPGVGHAATVDPFHDEARATDRLGALIDRHHGGHRRTGSTQRVDHPRFPARVEVVHDARLARRLEHHAPSALGGPGTDGGDDPPRTVRVALGQQLELHALDRLSDGVAAATPAARPGR